MSRTFFSIRLVWCLLGVLLLLTGCRGDDTPEGPDVPAVYYDLLDAMTAGKRLSGVERIGESTRISFTDGSLLEIPLKELFIYDCTESDPAPVTVNSTTGTWRIGQKDTGIRQSSSSSARACQPVYAWFTWTSVSMIISNGETFTLRGSSPSGNHRLPIIRITTDGGRSISDKETYVPGSIVFEDPDCLYSDVPYLESRMGIRGRGNTSWSFEKKSWKVKLDEKQAVFGIHKDKDWALLANYSDKTLLRNMVAMELSRILGLRWTPAMVSAEVYLNGQYQGCYVLAEHKEVSKEKVDIQPVTEQDNEGEALTGDYYIEIDGHQDEPFCFWTGVGIPVMLKEPNLPTDQQKAYIRQLFSDFEKVLYSDAFADPRQGYARFIDVESFVKYFIVEELTKNVDGNLRSSTFMTKHRNGKMVLYHVWDFDIALGNCNYFPEFWEGATNSYEGWFVKDYINASKKNDGWFGRLFQDPVFLEAVRTEWKRVFPQLQGIPEYIDAQAELLGKAADRNFEKWPILSKKVWPNVVATGSYKGELDYLKEFYTSRLFWMDAALAAL